ncbi:MAG: RnfABCDGE type electron transport complex subunit B [Gammaproteobacteria bacterium]|nr:RnfABCDGE type electron transport complex subunit B [Gammaproteobacteria bacterium]
MPSSMPAPDLVVRLDTWLPQTQCTRCGFPNCRAYAEALAAGDTDINRCPPGGDVTLHALAKLLGIIPEPLDPACGAPASRTRAVIDETRCIGCRKCLDVCPVDAILGAHKRMHTVIDPECNGCGLCLPPCPVDCIVLAPIPASGDRWPEYTLVETERWRRRAEARRARLERKLLRKPVRRGSIFPDRDTIRRDITAALERTKQKRNRQD